MEPEAARQVVIALRLKELIQAPGWEVYRQQMEAAEGRYVERLISCDKDEHDYIRGMIEGLRLAWNMPKLLIERPQTT